jgi:hypothetical protein
VVLLATTALVLLEFDLRQRIAHSSDAEKKGLQLLLENLTPEQRQQYKAFGYFDAIGSHTGKRYRIYHGTSRNVVELVGERNGPGRCFMPKGDLVAGDCMLAQNIAIENYEEEVLSTALRF